MSKELLKQCFINGMLCFCVGFGLALIGGGWDLTRKRATEPRGVHDSPEFNDADRAEPVTAENTGGWVPPASVVEGNA